MQKENIDPQQAFKMIGENQKNANFVILDVRTCAENSLQRIQNSQHLSVFGLQGNLNQLNKDKTYLVYCKSGARSNNAANILRRNGFKHVINMTGGIIGWNARSLPTVGCCSKCEIY